MQASVGARVIFFPFCPVLWDHIDKIGVDGSQRHFNRHCLDNHSFLVCSVLPCRAFLQSFPVWVPIAD